MDRNQCDGCNRNLPLNEDGDHVDPSSWMGIVDCTAQDYEAQTGDPMPDDNVEEDPGDGYGAYEVRDHA